MRTRAEQFDHFTAQPHRAKIFDFQFHCRRIEPGIIQHIIKQIEQAPAAHLDRLGIFALRWGQFGLKQQGNCAENTVQGRANFMTRRCQEGVFRLGGICGRLL